MPTSGPPYIDALNWASDYARDPSTPAQAFVYGQALELYVMVPYLETYRIMRFTGKKLPQQRIRFVL